ncbi:unnamed protein product [Lactuca saligna]|uniref:Uncharacterized protein n=1 Tax=Lactuca saligna TaxID=75948 RepID=A0AA36E591_LACSI|nr:unnamed protein product [Lactuca saligna]
MFTTILERKACVRVLEDSTVMLIILLADGKGYASDELDKKDDKDFELLETTEYEHECDEKVHTFDKTVGDPFLDKLLGNISDDDEEDEENNGKDKDVVFPVRTEDQEWEQMVPVLSMKFSNQLKLKLCATNYALKNRYDLWDRKSFHELDISETKDDYMEVES